MKRYVRRLTAFFYLLNILFLFSFSPVLANEKPKRVLIIPLVIHSEKDLTFLNKGIMDMMASRISQSATVIRNTDPDPAKDPLQKGRDLNADYVVTGSLTLFGNSASTDATLTEIDTGLAALQFNQFGQSSGDVLMHINEFATQVSRHIADVSVAKPQITAPIEAAPAMMVPLAPPAQSPLPPQPAVVAVTQASVPPAAPVVAATAAPPQASAPSAEPVAAATAAAPQASALPAAPVVAATAVPQASVPPAAPVESLWTSNPFKGTISALATADVDGDGSLDIIFAHEHQIVVEHRDGERLNRMAVFDAGKRHTIISVDAGDINGNGTAEIFVTRLNVHSKLDSVVLEWNGSGLQPIAGGQRWYFRVSDDPEKGRILTGQRRGSPSSNDTGGLYTYTHFLPGVVELTWIGQDYQAGRRFPLPNDLDIYRFTQGNIFNDSEVRTIAYSPSDDLRIYDPSGTPQWAGQETLGGSPLFLEAVSTTDSRSKDRTYLTQRFIVADLDGDGKVEVVTVHNRDAARGFVERFRKYTRGRVIALRWNKVNMKEIWTGETISGYISDFSLADLNGDGRLEAVYAMVTSTGITQAKSSNIVVEQIGELSGK